MAKRLVPILALVVASSGASSAWGAPRVWVIDDGLKVKQNATSLPQASGTSNPIWQPGQAVKLFALRNETVAIQVVVQADSGALSGVRVDLDTLTGPGGARIQNGAGSKQPTSFVGRYIERFVEHFLNIERASGAGYDPRTSLGWSNGSGPDAGAWTGPVPDALIPVEVAPAFAPYPMSIRANQNGIVWIDITVPRNQTAGSYKGEIVVRSASAELSRIPVELTIYDRVLPDMPTKTMLAYSEGNISNRVGADAYPAVEKHMWQLLHRHRISPLHSALNSNQLSGHLPALDGSLYSQANGYEGAGEGQGDNILTLGLYGGFGEPNGYQLGNVEGIANVLGSRNLFSSTEVFVYAIDESCESSWGAQWKSLLSNSGNSNARRVLVGWTCSSDPSSQPVDIPIVSAQGYNIATARQATSNGKRVWIYNGKQPHAGAFMTDVEAVAPRVNGWIAGRYKIPRWFYWESTFWCDCNPGGWGLYDPFARAETFHNNYNEWCAGDGVLLYPGKQVNTGSGHSIGMNGVIASIRLKNWRRGIEDAGYLQLARAVNASAADAIADELLGKTLNNASEGSKPAWPLDGQRFHAARKKLLALLAGAAPDPAEPPGSGTIPDPEPDPLPEPEAALEVPMASRSVTLDGDLSEFSSAPAVTVTTGEATGVFRVLWDSTALYVGVEVRDADLYVHGRGKDNPDLWHADGIEVHLDPMLTLTAQPDDDDRQVICTVAGDVYDAHGSCAVADTSFDLGITRSVVPAGTLNDTAPDTGYKVELKIPWSGIGVSPEKGILMGADFALNNDSATGFLYGDWANLKNFGQPSQWKPIRLAGK